MNGRGFNNRENLCPFNQLQVGHSLPRDKGDDFKSYINGNLRENTRRRYF